MNIKIIDYDLLSIQEARILVENAKEAQKQLATFSQEKLNEIVDAMAKAASKHTKELAEMSADETDYGKWQDKYIKNRFVCEYLPTQIKDMQCVGIIRKDETKKIMDVGVPLGVIIGICPATSPVSTTIYNALIAVKSGNAIVFSPHPRAKKTASRILDILISAARDCGLPEGAIAYLHTVTPAGACEMMNHKFTSLILNTGVPGMLQDAYATGKPVIYGGNGNGPTFIERTANIHQAVLDIITSKTFDNGMVSAAEQAIVVDSCVAAEVKAELEANGGYFMNDEEASKLAGLLYYANGEANSETVGKTAKYLAKKAGFTVPDDTKVLLSHQKYVSENNPYSKEKLCPVLAYYIEDDWMHACEKCIELLVSENKGHTLVIHSNDEEVIKQFALKKPVGRMLVNTPAVFGSMGATTNLFPAMTLGSGLVGKGMTSDNVSPMNLVYIRKVGYGVRRIEDMGIGVPENSLINISGIDYGKDEEETINKIAEILLEVILKNK